MLALSSICRIAAIALSMLLVASPAPAWSQSAVIDQADRSVVRIINTKKQRGTLVIYGAGSGIVVDDDGRILTNAHVIDGADKVFVHWKTDSGSFRKAEAQVVRVGDELDLALLQVPNMDSPPIAFASALPRKSSPVFAIGFPGVADTGLAVSDIQRGFVETTVTQGVVSRLLVRTFPGHRNWPLVQHSAVISSGSSGGALINSCGEVVGVNVAVALDETGGGDVVSAAGFGFAVQSPAALKFAISHGAEPSESTAPCSASTTEGAAESQVRNVRTWSISPRTFALVIASFALLSGATIFFLRRPEQQPASTVNNSPQKSRTVVWNLDGQTSTGDRVNQTITERSNPRSNPLVLGRDPTSSARVFDPTVSRNHAQLYVKAGELWCIDLNSSNGTHIDSRRVSEVPARVASGATLLIGKVALKVSASIGGGK